MDDENTFEPDYFEDSEHSTYFENMSDDSIKELITSEEHNNPAKNVEIKLTTFVNTSDEDLTGDGELFEDVSVDCVQIAGPGNIDEYKSNVFNENGLRKSCEVKLKEAIRDKQWDTFTNVFTLTSSNPNLAEQLSFFCADRLTSPAEFLGMLKFLKNGGSTHYDVAAMIGSKLLVNADLCSNFNAGIVILKMMLDDEVWFHHLNIKTFSVTDVVKAAVQSCLFGLNYNLLYTFFTCSKLFSIFPTNSTKENYDSKSFVSNQMRNLNVFFQYTIQFISSSKDLRSLLTLAVCCKDILKLVLDSGFFEKKDDQTFGIFQDLPNKVWILIKMFMDTRTLNNVTYLTNLSSRYPQLITWSLFDYGSVISFLARYPRQIRRFLRPITAFLKLLHHQGLESLPAFSEYKSGDTLRIYSSMSYEEMKLFISLFTASVNDCNNCTKTIRWNIFVINKDPASYNQANIAVQKILKMHFKFLKWSYVKDIYVVDQSVRKIVSLMMVKTRSAYEIKSETHSFFKMVKSSGPSLIEEKCALSKSDLPGAVINHPRFASKDSDGRGQTLISQKEYFSKSLNTQRGLLNHENSFTNTKIDSWPDSEVYQRLKCDVNSRLTHYINSGELSSVAARYMLLSMPDELFNSLPKDSNGRAFYDDNAFERTQSLIDAKLIGSLNLKK